MSLQAPFMTKIVEKKKKEEQKFMILSSVQIISPVDLGAYLALGWQDKPKLISPPKPTH